jgi:adenylate cyclase
VPSRKRVLVVEDEPDLRTLYKSTLALAGFAVVEARSGFEALLLIEAQPFDVIVLDLGLPGISGLTVRAEIASHASTRHIPVVVVTGMDAVPGDLDAACVLKKPVQPDLLVETVKKCLATGGRQG